MEIEVLKKEIINYTEELEKNVDTIGKQNEKTDKLMEKIEEIKVNYYFKMSNLSLVLLIYRKEKKKY
jgi:hypothetical protein